MEVCEISRLVYFCFFFCFSFQDVTVTVVQAMCNIKGKICKEVDVWFSFPSLTDPTYNPKVYLMSWEWNNWITDWTISTLFCRVTGYVVKENLFLTGTSAVWESVLQRWIHIWFWEVRLILYPQKYNSNLWFIVFFSTIWWQKLLCCVFVGLMLSHSLCSWWMTSVLSLDGDAVTFIQ